jgi:uncharacterized protein YbcV (DUF1398 family)
MIDVNLLKECLNKKVAFPERIHNLSQIGIERYYVDLMKLEITYYSHDGGSYVEHMLIENIPALAINFDKAKVIEAIRASQQGKIDYQTFLREIIEAGTVSYTVYLDGKQVVYVGRKGESHTENFRVVVNKNPLDPLACIGKDQMIVLLVSACPDFNKQWEEFLTEYADELNKPYYIALGDFASHLINKLNQNDIADFPKIFSVVEDLHVRGEPDVREAITVGLLEAIQNRMLADGKDPEVFMKFLGKETTKWWNKLNTFWKDGKILSDDD